jgi:hypothetical protein
MRPTRVADCIDFAVGVDVIAASCLRRRRLPGERKQHHGEHTGSWLEDSPGVCQAAHFDVAAIGDGRGAIRK